MQLAVRYMYMWKLKVRPVVEDRLVKLKMKSLDREARGEKKRDVKPFWMGDFSSTHSCFIVIAVVRVEELKSEVLKWQANKLELKFPLTRARKSFYLLKALILIKSFSVNVSWNITHRRRHSDARNRDFVSHYQLLMNHLIWLVQVFLDGSVKTTENMCQNRRKSFCLATDSEYLIIFESF